MQDPAGMHPGEPVRDDQTTRVLLAVANARQAAALKAALQAAPPGFTISPVRRLWSAAQLLAGLPIDVVLLSLDLPDQHTMAHDADADSDLIGLFVLQKERGDVPIIIVGGDPARGARALAAGASAFLGADDFTPECLHQQISIALAHKRSAGPNDLHTPNEPTSTTMQILLVEEEPLVQRLLGRNLTHQGHHVEIIPTPQDAIFWAKEHTANVDLLICDLHPTAMDGARLSQHLRRDFPAMRTLLLSPAHETPRTAQSDAGSTFYLPKPYDFTDFQKMIAAIEQQLVHASDPQPRSHTQPASN